jgi:hypothetical protein
MITEIETLRSIYNLIELGLDDYKENDFVLNIIHDLKQFFEESNCTCKKSRNNKDLRTCYEKIGFKRFFERHIEMKALEKHERELVIKTQLRTFEINNESENPIMQKYRYCYNTSFIICQPTYLKICRIDRHMLNTLQNHLHLNGLNERVHGNIRRIPKFSSRVFLNSDIIFLVKQFLVQYSSIHGLPSPMRHRNDSETFIYLPTDKTIRSIYHEYKDYYIAENNESKQIISYTTFRRL